MRTDGHEDDRLLFLFYFILLLLFFLCGHAWKHCCLLPPSERWAGVAKSVPHSSARPHRAIHCVLTGEWGTLFATPAHSPRVVEWPERQCCSIAISCRHSICPPACSFLCFTSRSFVDPLVRLLAGNFCDPWRTSEFQLLPNSFALYRKCEVIHTESTAKAIAYTTDITCPAWQY